MYGVWWSGAEPDVRPAEDGAKGYNAVTLQHAAGQFKVHEDLKKHVYDKGKGAAKWEETGEVLYMRGMINAMLGVEAIRTAQEKFGKKPLTGEQVRWGFENLDITAERLKELGFEGVLKPIKVSLRRPRGRAQGRIQTWDGKNWKITSDWYSERRRRHRPDGQGRGRQIRGREEDHRRLPRPTDVGPGDATHEQEAAAPPPSGARRDASRAAAAPRRRSSRSTTSRWSTTTSSWCSRASRSRCPRARSSRCSAPTAPASRPRSRRSPTCCRAERGEVTKGSIVFDGAEVHALTAQRAGAARLHPGDGRPPLLRPSHGRGEPAHRRLHAPRRQGGDQARPRAGLRLFPAAQGAPRRRSPATPRAASSRCARSAAR